MENILKNKSFLFAVRIVNMSKYLRENNNEFVLTKQILRAGTSIGAMVRESEYAESKQDFIHKLNIALKEAIETEYWLELLFATDYIDENLVNSLKMDNKELIKMLISSIKTTK
ncbi:MAG: four helix bundle protein [Bacteroidales bacterium]|nr:four helix bundle protein [Bacteroidales bacterium]